MSGLSASTSSLLLCDQQFIPKRRDAQYCSNRCKQQAHRDRLAEQQLGVTGSA
jgi:hypothetical protein